jgi:single-strand DNA-binding protein
MQLLIITGNLGKDPEMRYTPDGKAVTAFSVGVKDGKKTLWVKVSVWETLGEMCNQYLHKGSKVQVIGRLQYTEKGQPRTYETKDGQHAASFEMTAQQVEFLSAKEPDAAPVANEAEIPF